MLDKIKALWAVMQAGAVVADPVAWKRGQITGGYLVALLSALVALAKAFGVALPVTDDQLAAVATVVFMVWGFINHGATVASTDRIDYAGRTADASPAADPAPVFQPVPTLDRREPAVPRELSGPAPVSADPVDVAAPSLPAQRSDQRNTGAGWIDPFANMGG